MTRIARIAFLGLFLGATPTFAQDTAPVVIQDEEVDEADLTQGWIPSEIVLPEDMEITIDRRIGSANRVFSFTTAENVEELIDTWREALDQGPYQVKPAAEGMATRMIEFSGGRVRNGQITFVSGAESTDTTVQFDASLTD